MKRKSLLLIVSMFLFSFVIIASAQEKHWSKYKYPTEIPADAKVHYIVKGDTLWDLAAHYLGDPYLWPKIWELNKYITDPDLIFPQDPLIIPEVKVVSPEPQVVPEEEIPEEEREEIVRPEEEAEEEEEPVTEEGEPTTPSLIAVAIEADLFCSPLILSNKDSIIGKVVGAEEKSAMGLSVYDVIYIDCGSKKGVKPGEQYTILREEKYDIDYSKSNKIGTVYNQAGVLKILAVQSDTSIAQITRACDFVSIGDHIVPYIESIIPMVEAIPELDKLTPASSEIRGSIIFAKDKQVGIGEHSLVLIDLGKKQQVKPGDFFRIFDSNKSGGSEINQIIGMLVIIRAEEEYSLCRILKSLKDITIGSPVEIQ